MDLTVEMRDSLDYIAVGHINADGTFGGWPVSELGETSLSGLTVDRSQWPHVTLHIPEDYSKAIAIRRWYAPRETDRIVYPAMSI